MNQKSTSFIVILIVLLGAFAFVMFSPSAKKEENMDQNTNIDTNTNINLEENMDQNTNTTQNDPLTVEILKEGSGEPAVAGNTVTVSYIGTLTDGTEFDKSANHGDGKFTFQVGMGQVIKGWDEGIIGMKVGEVRKLTISPEYGYGAQAIGTIPANSTLVFEVEMFEIK